MSIFHSEWFWDDLTFALFIVGLCGEVLIAAIAAILVHINLSESKKKRLNIVIEWSAVICAVLIVAAIISERIHENILKNTMAEQFQTISNRFPRSLNLMQQRGIESMINMEPNKPPIVLFLNENASDAEFLGNQLETVFKRSGYSVNRMSGVTLIQNPHGIGIGEYGTPTRSMFEIYGALKWCDLEVITNNGVKDWTNQIVVDIEPQ